MSNKGVVNIHGKEYKTVALRVNEFRGHPDTKNWGVETELIHNNPELVIMKAVIKDDSGRIIGTGWAEEKRDASKINQISALENCETSAIGRALAAVGLAGEEYASANEVSDAIIQQKQKEVFDDHVSYMNAVKSLFPTVAAIKQGISDGDMSSAAEAWFELSDDDKRSLWRTPTKGGVFTIEERDTMGSRKFRETHYGETPEAPNE